jgi:hypothetical protein
MNVSNPVGVRTILTTLSNDTTTSSNITVSIALSNGTNLSASGTVNLICYSTDLLTISSATLSLTSSTSKYLCTPEFLIVDEHMLWGIKGKTVGILVG